MSSTVVQTRFTANDGLFDRRGHVHAPGSECDVQSNPHRNASPHGDCSVNNARTNCVTESRDFETPDDYGLKRKDWSRGNPANRIVYWPRRHRACEAASSSAAARFARSSGTPIEQNPFFIEFPRRPVFAPPHRVAMSREVSDTVCQAMASPRVPWRRCWRLRGKHRARVNRAKISNQKYRQDVECELHSLKHRRHIDRYNNADNSASEPDSPGAASPDKTDRQRGFVLKRFPAKWRPVRVKKTRQIKNLEPRFDSIETEKALEFR